MTNDPQPLTNDHSSKHLVSVHMQEPQERFRNAKGCDGSLRQIPDAEFVLEKTHRRNREEHYLRAEVALDQSANIDTAEHQLQHLLDQCAAALDDVERGLFRRGVHVRNQAANERHRLPLNWVFREQEVELRNAHRNRYGNDLTDRDVPRFAHVGHELVELRDLSVEREVGSVAIVAWGRGTA